MRVATGLAATAVMIATAVLPRAGATSVEALYQALEPHVLIETQRINQVAIAAALQAIDAGAELRPTGQSDAPATGSIIAIAEPWPEGLARVKVNGLHSDGRADALASLRALLKPDTIGLILDLRGAGGSDLDTLDAFGGLFFATNTPLYDLRDGYGNVLATHVAHADAPPPSLPPVMLLVDRGTHGASEALAAILRHHSGVMLLGETTRGDSAQRVRVPFTDAQDLWVGTSCIVPSDGGLYAPAGVHPHVPVSPAPPGTNLLATTSTDAAAPLAATPAAPLAATPADTNATDIATAPAAPLLATFTGKDPVLRRAADIILGLHALRKP
ncbi:MAG: hypothetical protein K8T26_12895 [Lentisphaerae bacterium]|nr:hypothetical protein [Lentisphaerota bacterium]